MLSIETTEPISFLEGMDQAWRDFINNTAPIFTVGATEYYESDFYKTELEKRIHLSAQRILDTLLTAGTELNDGIRSKLAEIFLSPKAANGLDLSYGIENSINGLIKHIANKAEDKFNDTQITEIQSFIKEKTEQAFANTFKDETITHRPPDTIHLKKSPIHRGFFDESKTKTHSTDLANALTGYTLPFENIISTREHLATSTYEAPTALPMIATGTSKSTHTMADVSIEIPGLIVSSLTSPHHTRTPGTATPLQNTLLGKITTTTPVVESPTSWCCASPKGSAYKVHPEKRSKSSSPSL